MQQQTNGCAERERMWLFSPLFLKFIFIFFPLIELLIIRLYFQTTYFSFLINFKINIDLMLYLLPELINLLM